MYRSFFVKALSLTMAIVFPMACFAADTRAMLLPQGGVYVNGTVLGRSTVLVNGDRITTADNATGTITAPGNTINLGSRSSLVYNGGTVEMTDGGAAVITSSGTAGKVRNLTITPADGKAKYEFGQRGNKVTIAALEGKLRISDGQQQMMLDSGKAIEIASTSADDKDQGAKPASNTGFGVGNAHAVLIGLAVAAIGVGVTFGALYGLTAGNASPKR
jgi:hypothetical protein